MKKTFDNVAGKNPNQCHDFLISNSVKPIYFEHNREYNEDGSISQEATEFYVAVQDVDVDTTTQLVEQFMSQ